MSTCVDSRFLCVLLQLSGCAALRMNKHAHINPLTMARACKSVLQKLVHYGVYLIVRTHQHDVFFCQLHMCYIIVTR